MLCHSQPPLQIRLGGSRELEEPAGPARVFDAALRLEVLFPEGPGGGVLLGETPSPGGRGVPVPPLPFWAVRPIDPALDDAGLREVAALLRAEGIPGLDLGACSGLTDAGLASLAGLDRLRWLGLSISDGVRGEGLSVLRTLPGLTHLALLEMPRFADHLPFLPALRVLSAPGADFEDADLAALAGCPELRVLDLVETGITDAGLEEMAPLPRLEEFRLGGWAGTVTRLAPLRRHDTLRCIAASRVRADGSDLSALAGLPGLSHLHDLEGLDSRGVLESLAGLPALAVVDPAAPPTPAVVAGLSRIRTLEELDLDGAELLDEDVAPLAGLEALRYLRLRNTWITDAGLAALAPLRRMEALDLSLTEITDAGLSCLAGMGGLRSIALDGCAGFTGSGLSRLPPSAPLEEVAATGSGFEVAGLATLGRFPGLRRVDLGRTRVPAAALEEFQARLDERSGGR